MLQLVQSSCDNCGTEIQAACLAELQEKKAKHKCVKVNKRVQRTVEVQQAHVDQFVKDVTVDRIHEYVFAQLVKKGIFVRA